jgi:hypothetical protein
VIESLEIDVTCVPSGGDLEGGPAIMIVPAGDSASTSDLYRQFREAPASCRAREGVVAIVSTGVLNTPDQVSATGRRRDGYGFEMNIEIRRFEGPLAGNDPWLALVRMEIGSLEPGAYQLAVQETVLRFMDLHHPERATNPTTSEQRMSFNCV